MRCPSCGHERTAPHLRCSHCNRIFPREVLEQYDRLTFLFDQLSTWERARLIDEGTRLRLAALYDQDLRGLEEILGQPGAPGPIAVAEPGEQSIPPPVAVPVPLPAGAFPAPAPSITAPATPPPRRAIPRPSVSWELLWRALLSERTLEAVLYVGAFLIVAAAVTLVYFNWGRFSPVLQLLFLAVGTAAFFIFGWLLRSRWHLVQSGVAFIGIGALVIPVDFFAWARFRALPPSDDATIWLVASIFCGIVYAATSRWLRHGFFLVMTLLAGYSLALSVVHVIAVPMEWWGPVVVLASLAWVTQRRRLNGMAAGFGDVALMIALAFAAAGLIAPPLTQRDASGGLLVAVAPTGPWTLPAAGSWWVGSVLAVLVHRQRPSAESSIAAAIMPAAAVVFTLLSLIPPAWVSLGILILAVPYIIVARRHSGSLEGSVRVVGIALSVLAHVWALVDPRTTAAVFLAGSALYASWAFTLRQPVFLPFAQTVGMIGLLRLLDLQHVAPVYWPMGVMASALVGLGGAALARDTPESAGRLYAGALVELALALLSGIALEVPHPAQVVLAGGALGASIYLAVLTHRKTPGLQAVVNSVVPAHIPVFQWSAAVLAAATLAVAWGWWRPVPHWLPAAGLILASVFVALARRLERLSATYARLWQVAALLLSLLSLGYVGLLRERVEIALTLFLATAVYALWAGVVHDSRYAHLAAWLFIGGFTLLLPDALQRGLIPSREAYAWAFAGLAVAYLGAGLVLDRRGPPFATAPHLLSHVLIPFALLWSLQEEAVAFWTLAIAIPFYAVSAWLLHTGRHPTAARRLARRAGLAPGASSPPRAIFVYAATWLFPFWFNYALRRVPAIGHDHARLGAGAALLAWGYLAVGQWIGRSGAQYRLPLRIAAQTLALVGGMLAAAEDVILIVTVAGGSALQVAFYRLTRHVAWVYTAALGGAGLIGLLLAHFDVSAATGGWTMILLAALYLGIAEVSWRRSTEPAIPQAPAALYAIAFLLAVVGVLLAAFELAGAAAIAYVLAAPMFLWAGWRLREPLFGYPVAGLLAAGYVSALVVLIHHLGAPATRYGIWLAPGIGVYLLAGRLLERRARVSGIALLGAAWAGPFYVAAQVGIAAMMLHSAGDPRIFPLALGLGAAAYGICAAFFRSPVWLYPALLVAHASLFFGLLRVPLDPRLVPVAFVPLAALLLAVGYRVEAYTGRRPLRELSWLQPWYLAVAANLILWELAGVIDARGHVIVSVGFAVLAGAFAQWRREDWAASLALALLVVGFGEWMRWQAMPYPTVLLTTSLVSLFFGILLAALRQAHRATLWWRGLRGLALLLSIGALGTAVFGVIGNVHPQAGEGFVYTLSLVGLLYLLSALVNRREWLGYLGVAMLELAWALFLLKRFQVQELQWYAIPVALYLFGVGTVERRFGRRSLARLIEAAGLVLLFGSSLWESLQPSGFNYAVLLAVEAVLVAWAGAALRRRPYFFGGLGMLLVNVIAQAVDPLRSLDKTVLFLSLGVVLMVTAVVAERKREEIIRTTREWRTRLEAWE